MLDTLSKYNVAKARGVICFLAVREIGYSGVAVGQILNMNTSGVCIAASVEKS
jgi:hypothetical protein